MSAFLLPKAHIDVLVQSLVVYDLLAIGAADEAGKAMMLENYRSLAARYGDPVPSTIDYRFVGIEAPLDPAIVLAATHSYLYQSSEHLDFASSGTRMIVDLLQVALRVDLREKGDMRAADEGFVGDDRGWVIADAGEAVLR